MSKIKRGEEGHNAGKTIKKKNPKAVNFEKKLAQEDKNKAKLKKND